MFCSKNLDKTVEKNLWDKYSIEEVIIALLSWGYGSGEELSQYLRENGLTKEEISQTFYLLNKALSKPEGVEENNQIA
jgi:hypothetical protein